jgi:hypothetical protein
MRAKVSPGNTASEPDPLSPWDGERAGVTAEVRGYITAATRAKP